MLQRHDCGSYHAMNCCETLSRGCPLAEMSNTFGARLQPTAPLPIAVLCTKAKLFQALLNSHCSNFTTRFDPKGSSSGKYIGKTLKKLHSCVAVRSQFLQFFVSFFCMLLV